MTVALSIPQVSDQAQRILAEVERAVVGKRRAAELVLSGILAGGHVLMEDFPGLGKTLAARSFAQALGLGFARAQFTPDLLPSDLTGSFLYDQRNHEFTFRQGPLFTGLLLADEINRTPPKTQSALLEAMQEGQVTVEGETFPLPRPFHVLATANPVEYEGTYPLPEAQLDRFLLRVNFGYPTPQEEWEVLQRRMARGPGGADRRPGHRRRGPAGDAAGDRERHRRRERGAVLRQARRRDPAPPAPAHGLLAARLPRAAPDGPGVCRGAGPRLRHPRRRQGCRPRRPRPPRDRAAGAVDERGELDDGRRVDPVRHASAGCRAGRRRRRPSPGRDGTRGAHRPRCPGGGPPARARRLAPDAGPHPRHRGRALPGRLRGAGPPARAARPRHAPAHRRPCGRSPPGPSASRWWPRAPAT